ncbi:Aste57867_10677 [Aphanomyces stellatus]|uniref:Aste57867_10677 protein n=1 Tax=Aphanomyces stellatus TaxID=120398 RepID=A0A485KS34_9STRA|nr:hypothetical protein As57867_010637 [Aphanomyces stellatus]VFT87549.1 Aste57867_10677 [Aphanomyces stellatus]
MRRSPASHPSAPDKAAKDHPQGDAFREFDLQHAACLTKRGKTIHHVVLRVFVIADGFVFYFKNAAATQPSGLLPISGSEFKLHKYQVGPHGLFNICFELQTPLRSWGSVVLHYHNCTDAHAQSTIEQLEHGGSRRIYGAFSELSQVCPAADVHADEGGHEGTAADRGHVSWSTEVTNPIVKEACPSTESMASQSRTTLTTTSSLSSLEDPFSVAESSQIHHVDKQGGVKVPVLDLTWTELHEHQHVDLCKALGLPMDEQAGEKVLDISNDLCHDLCTSGSVVRPWGTLSMESSAASSGGAHHHHGHHHPQHPRRLSSSLSSSSSSCCHSDVDVGSSTLDASEAPQPSDTDHQTPPPPSSTAAAGSPPTDKTLRRRRSSLHKRHASRDAMVVVSSGVVVPQKAVPDVKLIQAISLAESYSGGFSLRQYTPLKMIGKGGFGQVMVARHNATHQIVAIKTMNKHTLTTQNQVAHTKSERNVLIKCYNHPFIVKLLASFQTIDHLHMVLEFCPGGELFFHLSRVGRFPEAHAAFYCAEIFLALDHLHAHAIIYRDLKPENVLLDRDGHVRLADFGLSKEGVSERKLAATFCGSAEYISPEVLALADTVGDDGTVPHLGGYDKGVDLWALGCLVFELLTGLPPFYSGKCRADLYAKIKDGFVDFPPYLSPEAQDLVTGLLHPTPQLRLGYKDASELKRHPFFLKHIDDWDRLMAREMTPPMQPSPGEYMNFDDVFTSMPLDKEALQEMAEFTKRNTMEHQLFDNYNWAPPEQTTAATGGHTLSNAS